MIRAYFCRAVVTSAIFGWSALLASAQEMPSRARSIDAQEAASNATTIQLRSTIAPRFSVVLSPSQALLREAANSARGKAKGAASEKTVSTLLGLGKEPPVAPYYVGPVLDSGMAAKELFWQAVPGGNVTHIVVSSAGAMGIRAKLQLPPGLKIGEIRVAATVNGVAEALPLRLSQDGVLWTPYIEGSEQIIEIFTPQKVSKAQIRVVSVSHFTESILTGKVAKDPSIPSAPTAGSCTIDVACTTNSPALDSAIAERSNSVAKINFATPSGNFICSGTLINSNTGSVPFPYFLLANHCISTQAEAASVSTIWFRKNLSCGANVANENNAFFPGQVTLSGGAQLVFTNQMADSTLLRLNQNPPAGTVYSGWNAALLNNGDPVISLSHPAGAPMKRAQGTVDVITATGQPSTTNTTGLLGLQGYNQQMYGIFFTQGIIEGGSSGSGLFTVGTDGGLQLRGVLSSSTLRNGTSLSCTNLNENANYGRFEIFYEQIKYFLNGQALPASDDYPNQPSPTGPVLPLNGTLNASLNYIGDLDVFRVVVTEPGTLSVGSRGLAADGTPLDTMAILLQSDGSCMPDPTGKSECNNNATNDDAPDTVPPASPRDTNFLIKDIAVQPGTYYVSVGMWDPQAITPSGYQVYSTFVSARSPQTITFLNPDSQPLSNGTVPFTATASSGLSVTVSSLTTSVCSVTGSNISLSGAGVCTITADQAGNTIYATAAQVSQSFIVYTAQPLSKRGAIDIDGNNKSVLLVRSPNAIVPLRGGRLQSNQFVFTPQADPGPSFRLVGATDFDGNGKTDLAFQNPTVLDVNGRSNVLAWNDFSAVNERTIRLVKPVWDVQAVGDLDGDGLGDLVWRYVADDPRDTGVSYIWFSNGGLDPVVRKRGGAPLSWKLLGAADLNGNGAADMIYISPTGNIRALMATAARTCANFSAGDIPSGFTALKLADFTGKRRGDILIRNESTGETRLLSLNAVGMSLPPYIGDPADPNASCTASTQVVPSKVINLPFADPTWQFYAAGDFNGDGIFDIVWKQSNGTLTVWLMGSNGVVQTTIANAGIAPSGYTVFQP